MKKMIFHIPYFVDLNRHSGSHIRPMKMLQAFKNIGYDVDIVIGYGDSRKKSIRDIKENINKGVKYDFCYSESSTMPTLLTEANHLPRYPFLDFGFFKFLNKNNIKIGLFYRDCHWLFSQYKNTVSKPKQIFSSFFYRYDLRQYNKYVNMIYMPDSQMNNYLPISLGENIQNLPPALDKEQIYKYNKIPSNLNVFYVGGLGELYNLELFFKVSQRLEFINFTLCTRKDEWDSLKSSYSKYLTDRVNIVHAGPGEYDEILEKAHLALLYIEPKEYWKFAIPVKLFEYIKFKKPILTVKNTAVGRFVDKYKIGYVVDYNEKTLEETLINILKNMDNLDIIIDNFKKTIIENTWESRAKKVAEDLI